MDAVGKVKAYARVALHFHPDRPDREMKPVVEALLEEGEYRNQFETQLSSGGETAYPGGERDRWEETLFGGAYHIDGTTDAERPKYGALDLMLHPDGPSPRFGCCYFLLKPKVSQRSTFTYLDSSQLGERGTYEAFDAVLSAVMRAAFFGDFAIGERNLTVPGLVNHFLSNLDNPFEDPSTREANRNLNHYIEAQVHGGVSLAEDIELLVADPSFKATAVGHTIEELCSVYSIELYWHMGFTMQAVDVPSNFRGPAMPSLAHRIANNGRFDARSIGSEARDLRRDPGAWSDRGPAEEVRRELRYLWHTLVRYGEPYRAD